MLEVKHYDDVHTFYECFKDWKERLWLNPWQSLQVVTYYKDGRVVFQNSKFLMWWYDDTEQGTFENTRKVLFNNRYKEKDNILFYTLYFTDYQTKKKYHLTYNFS